jgi:hypothetical protein
MMTIGQQRYVRGSSAAKLLGASCRSAPFGKIIICPAGIKIEAASEDTTSKSKSSVIEILILKTAAKNDRVLSMVNDYSYWSISGDRPAGANSQRRRPHPERPQVCVFSLRSKPAETLRREATVTQRLAETAIALGAVLRLARARRPLTWHQIKRPLLGTAAERWEVSTSRGNDTIGRNNRVLPQMVRPSCAGYLPECQADMRSAHSSRLETATLNPMRENACFVGEAARHATC